VTRDARITRVRSKHVNIQSTRIEFGLNKANKVITLLRQCGKSNCRILTNANVRRVIKRERIADRRIIYVVTLQESTSQRSRVQVSNV